MKLSECVDKWAKEFGYTDAAKMKEAHLFAQSFTGPSAAEIDLNEQEQAIGKEIFRAMMTDPEIMSDNEARVKRIIQNT
jgi:hypothetical protein